MKGPFYYSINLLCRNAVPLLSYENILEGDFVV